MGATCHARTLLLSSIALCTMMSVARAGIHSFSQITPEEDARLPKYCETSGDRGATQVPPLPRAKPWFDLMGPGYKMLHHYCWAMVEMWRADSFKITPAQRTHWMGSAVDNMTFVVVNSPPDFVLHPEIFTRRAGVLARLGKHSAAIADYERAVELKPNYWPAYIGLAQLMRSIGQMAAARTWVERGLANAPDAQALLRLRDELNGIPAAASR